MEHSLPLEGDGDAERAEEMMIQDEDDRENKGEDDEEDGLATREMMFFKTVQHFIREREAEERAESGEADDQPVGPGMREDTIMQLEEGCQLIDGRIEEERGEDAHARNEPDDQLGLAHWQVEEQADGEVNEKARIRDRRCSDEERPCEERDKQAVLKPILVHDPHGIREENTQEDEEFHNGMIAAHTRPITPFFL